MSNPEEFPSNETLNSSELERSVPALADLANMLDHTPVGQQIEALKGIFSK